MGQCFTRNAPPVVKCNVCSKGLGEKGRKHFILCSNGHSVCSICQVKSGDQYLCPHCQTQIISIKAVQINKQFEDFKKLSATRSSKETILNQSQLHNSRLRESKIQSRPKKDEITAVQISQLDKGFERIGQVDDHISKQKNQHSTPILENTPRDNTVPLQTQQNNTDLPPKEQHNTIEPNQQIIQEQKPIQYSPLVQEAHSTQESKICGCSFEGFLLFLVLLIQVFLTLANAYFTYIEPHSQCMDNAHLHKLLVLRPLLLQVGGVQIVLFFVIVVSAFSYKIRCMSQSLFDKWIAFLKTLLGLKQLLWAALMALMQITIMPDQCSIHITRFSLISAIANGVSFLLLIAKPINSCLCTG